jgi:hypothetical protein
MYLATVTPPQRVWVEKTEENDSDLAEPVRIVSQELHMPVGILNPHQHHSKELQRYATFVKRIRQGHLLASQFPAILQDAKGSFSKPVDW